MHVCAPVRTLPSADDASQLWILSPVNAGTARQTSMHGSLMAIRDDSLAARDESAFVKEMADLPRESRLHRWTARALQLDHSCLTADRIPPLRVTGRAAISNTILGRLLIWQLLGS